MTNENKINYEEPKMEIIEFSAEDILSTSNGFEGELDNLGI